MQSIRQVLVLIFALVMPVAAAAQDYGAPQTLAPDQLEQLVAPIALYPDQLMGQILMAATYPLEVVEAGRWQQNPANAGLQGDQLAGALEQQPWDPSVKSLVPFPQVLQTMNQNIEWTEQLGNAFLAQQGDVMSAIQVLRVRAMRAGTLQSTPQQMVTSQGQYIYIQPANPAIVYVPAYNPETVYGNWAYPDYPPYDFVGYNGYNGYGLGFAVGVAVIAPLWGWHHWDWRDHRIDIDRDRYARLNEGRAPQNAVWQHEADHRHGVPYANPAVRQQFAPQGGGRPLPDRSEFRGYEPHAQISAPQPVAPHADFVRNAAPAEVPRNEARIQTLRPAPQPQMPQPEAEHHNAPPAFESFAHGPQVQQQQQRGAQSRPAMPQQPHAAPPQPHAGGDNQEHERR